MRGARKVQHNISRLLRHAARATYIQLLEGEFWTLEVRQSGTRLLLASSQCDDLYPKAPLSLVHQDIDEEGADHARCARNGHHGSVQLGPVDGAMRNKLKIFLVQRIIKSRHRSSYLSHVSSSKLRYALNISRSSFVVSLMFLSEPLAKFKRTPSCTIMVFV